MPEHDHMDSVHVGRGGDAEHVVFPERRSFDGLLVPFSSRCLNTLPDQLDEVIKQGLHEVNSFFGTDRVILWDISSDGPVGILTHAHAEAGAEPPVNSLPHEAIPYIFDSVHNLKSLCVSRLQDLPKDALIDLQYLEHSGIRSFMVIPLMAGGTFHGALSLVSIRTERTWSAEDLFRFQQIGSVLSGALDRKRSHHLLERRIQFETLITDISARLIKAPLNEVDEEIEQALTKVREIFQADRSALLDIQVDQKLSNVTHASYGEGIEPVSSAVNLAELFPWCFEQLLQGKLINICQVEDYPGEALVDRQFHAALGIKSALNIPLAAGGRISRSIVINHTRRHQIWPEEYISRLRLLGDIFVNALERRDDRLKLEEALRFKTLSAEISARFVNLPADQVEEEIEDAQRRICELLDLDRSSLWQVVKGKPRTMLLTKLYTYSGSLISPPRPMDGRDFFPWSIQKALEGETFTITKMTDLPPEADRDRESYCTYGTKSVVVVPLTIGDGPVLGLLTFAAIREERRWTETAVMGFKLIAQMLANALARQQAEQSLRNRLLFEQMVSNLSARFMATPFDQVDSEINYALRQIIEFFQVDRCALLEFQKDTSFARITHAAFGEGIEPVSGEINQAELFPWCYERLIQGKPINISRVEDYPEDALRDRQSHAALGIKSALNIPMAIGGRISRTIVINHVRRHQTWPEEYIPRLHLLGSIFVNALERKQAEAEVARAHIELLHVERSLHLNELTGSLAHELNQPLAAILSNAQAALRFLKADKPDLNEFKEIIQDIIADDQRAGNVIRSLRAMMKREEGEKQPTLLNDTLNDVIQIFRGEAILRNVQIETEWDESLPHVFCDKGQLQQVVLNLIMNGAEAMSHRPSEQRKLILQTKRKDHSIWVAVRDFGPGIDPDKLERVFEPFFTTKSTGLGMGLAVCSSIIKAHRGCLWAENNPDGGATFFFELPIYDNVKERG